MEILNGKLVLTQHECMCVRGLAGLGKRFILTMCEYQDSKGRTQTCYKKRCPNNLRGTRDSHEIIGTRQTATCNWCNGTGVEADKLHDHFRWPVDFPVIILRNVNRNNSFNESYLGFGCLYSCTDYGRGAKATDEELLAEVRLPLNRWTQGINLVRSKDDLTICDAIAVYVSANGYSARPYWTDIGPKQFHFTEAHSLAIARALGGNQTQIAGILE